MTVLALVPTTSTEPRPCRLIQWTPKSDPASTLLGYATVSFSGWVVNRIPIWRGNDGSLSPGKPGAPEVDGAGRVRLGADGKRTYWYAISFEGREPKERWERSILAALHAAGIGGAL